MPAVEQLKNRNAAHPARQRGGKNLFHCPIKRRARDSPARLREKQILSVRNSGSVKRFPNSASAKRNTASHRSADKKRSLSATFHETADRRYKSAKGKFYLTSNAGERYCLCRRDLSDEKIVSSIRRNVSSKAACNPHRNGTEPRKIPDSALIL